MNEAREAELAELMEQLGVQVGDLGLIDLALTHGSYANEAGVHSNERLEFLGDAVVGLAMGEALYLKHPAAPEGVLHRRRAAIVSAPTLAEHSRRLGLGHYLRLSRSEELNGGRDRPSILADAFEALVGAVYISCGWESARAWVVGQLEPVLLEAYERRVDHKTALQEALQAGGRGLPEYRLLSQEGPDHDRRFTVAAYAGNEHLGTGEGRSKKLAEQEAARNALNHVDSGN